MSRCVEVQAAQADRQITVNHVHIRYEDKLSVPGHPFAVGVTLAGFSVESTDAEWKPAYLHNSANGIHKIAKLDSLAVYFDTDARSLAGLELEEAMEQFVAMIARQGTKQTVDHQFVLKPVSGLGRLIMRKHLSHEHPKIDAELLFDELGFVVDGDQYRDALSVVDLFHFMTRQRQYHAFMPPDEEVAVNRPRALLRFALDAIRSEVHERHRSWSWAYFAERRDDRKAYVALFKHSVGPDAASMSADEHDQLAALERKLGYKDLRLYRSMARSALRKERAAAQQYAREHPQPVQQSSGGWTGWLWSAATGRKGGQAHEESSANLANDPSAEGMSDEQRKELFSAIDFDEREAVAAAVDAPKDAVALRIQAKLDTGSFALRRGGGGEDIISVVFDAFSADVLQRPESFEAGLALGGMRVYDGTRPGTLHPQIVRVKSDKGALLQDRPDHGDRREAVRKESDPDNPFFTAKFEKNPLDGRADMALAVTMRYMEVIYHRGYVEQIVAFFRPPESQLESVGALIDVASETLEGIRKETRAGLEYALDKHKTIDVRVDMNAPIIVVPEDVTKRTCQHIVLDAGHISIESELADQKAVDDIKRKVKSTYSDRDFAQLENLMYDKFFVRLDDAQLLMGDTLEACLGALDGGDGTGPELHVLERVSMTFRAENSILPKAPNLTRFRVSGELPDLRVNFSDRKYKILMRMVDVAIPHFDDPAAATEVRTTAAASATGPATAEPRRRRASTFVQAPLYGEEDVAVDEDGHDAAAAGEDEDEFFEAPDFKDGFEYRQKTFEFTFVAHTLTAAVYKADPDPSQPDLLLANAVLAGFDFAFALRSMDMGVDIKLRSLTIEDKMTPDGSRFTELVSSGSMDGDAQDGTQSPRDLVRIHYGRVNPDSPEFMTRYEGFGQSVDVEMSTINVIVTRASIVRRRRLTEPD